MIKRKVLIVGGVAGGASTAARLRRLDEASEIIMFERGDYISFANCGLPYYIGGAIEDREELLIQTPESMKDRFNIDVRIKQEVMSIDRESKKVFIKKVGTEEVYEESYDVLVLSPGSSPIKPPIKGIDRHNVFTLWNIPDVDQIKAFVDEHDLKTATIIGGGFIGLEMAENLHAIGLQVSIAEMADQVMAPIDFDMAQILHQHLLQKSVKLYLNNGVKEFLPNPINEYATDVVLSDGTKLESDIILLAIGVRANSELAKTSGLAINERGGIIVDEFLRTSDPSIYALGDVIEVEDFVNKVQTMIPLAGPANKQGRIVANNIVGIEETYKGTQGSSVAKVFDMTVANTGTSEKALKRLGKRYGIDYKIALVISGSHASYYPGATSMFLKLIFDISGKVLGAQAVGYDGVDKRIDVIATSIRFGATIEDLKELELAYAPPYSSAKDPVNMVAFIAENILSGKMDPIRPEEIGAIDLDKSILLDVRTTSENRRAHIPNNVLIPVDELRERIDELDPSKEIVIYCAAGLRGYIASNILKAHGFRTRNLLGGFNFYSIWGTQSHS
jgi:NADPH-dependent 2,4-dienoyl-CoA reductase/sulfur reductase-like enzyme/rhodanese-related sulfurtransferase